MKRNDIRNVAVIAHVDHGKTTLVDQMLRQSGLFRSEELDKLVGGQHGLIMDSNDQERERGITILAKNCGIRIGDVKVNLIDTPGHADFGGEVERILKMADGAFLLVDAAEGPLPQTRFVLKKAFAVGIKPIVIINKIDRPDARIGDVFGGAIRKNQKVLVVRQADGSSFNDTVVQVLEFDRLGRKEADEIRAGDVCAIVGLDDAEIGDTICEPDKPRPMPPLTIDEPTLDMIFRVNDSPFASKEGKPLTSRELRDRLERELHHNVALRVKPGDRESEFVVSGRGLLHLGVLLETMRREGSEVAVGKPRVIVKEVNGTKSEPYEHLVVEVPGEHQGAVMRLVLERQGEF